MTDMVLIHGAWLSARSWERFAEYLTQRGYAVETPEWPRKHGDVEELRESSDELAGLGIAEIVDHYDAHWEEVASTVGDWLDGVLAPGPVSAARA